MRKAGTLDGGHRFAVMLCPIQYRSLSRVLRRSTATKPNKGVQPTAYSLHSYVAPASGGG